MHEIDSDNAGPDGEWLPSDAMIPRHATRGTAFWFNAVQNEIKGVIVAAGIALRDRAGDIAASYSSQLLAAIRALNPTKAAARVRIGAGAASIVWGHGVSEAALVALSFAPGKYGVLVTYDVTTTPERVVEANMLSGGAASTLIPNLTTGSHVNVANQIGVGSNQTLLVLYDADGATITNLMAAAIDVFVRVNE